MNKKSVKLLSLMLSAMMMIVAIPMGVMAEFGGSAEEISSDLNAGKREVVSEAESQSGKEDVSEEESSNAVVPTTKGDDETTAPTTEPASNEPTSKEEESSERHTDKYLIMGDLDGNGKVTAEDARIALRIAARLQNATKYQMQVGDLNKDGKITAGEARLILRFAAKLDAVLQVG